ncbi:hypothetical protein CTI12_AA537070 [Artemisia annua]|uniref:Uncharacterized protein n=1 Tax=Artemisia annua TaxID=35608 RepID=A0A2U1L2R1_ARTAN|nr:hypothetical protein CTI12_AA537070 [Artemisia annua]
MIKLTSSQHLSAALGGAALQVFQFYKGVNYLHIPHMDDHSESIRCCKSNNISLPIPTSIHHRYTNGFIKGISKQKRTQKREAGSVYVEQQLLTCETYNLNRSKTRIV